MEYQTLFNVAVIVAGFFGGWTLNRIYSALDRLDKDVRELPHTYVAKEDYREDVREMKEMLSAIFKKLDAKADK